MAKNTRNSAQITCFATVIDSDRFPMETKQQVVSAPAGKVRVFRKVLVDPKAFSPELQELIAAEVAGLKEAKDAETDPKAKARIETGEVVIKGKALIGGIKDGKVQETYANGKARKHSLMCRAAFKVNHLESFLDDAKAQESVGQDEDLLAALMGASA